MLIRTSHGTIEVTDETTTYQGEQVTLDDPRPLDTPQGKYTHRLAYTSVGGTQGEVMVTTLDARAIDAVRVATAAASTPRGATEERLRQLGMSEEVRADMLARPHWWLAGPASLLHHGVSQTLHTYLAATPA